MDVIITLLVFAFLRLIKKDLPQTISDFFCLAIIGLIIAIAIEQNALLAGKWNYAPSMPIIPGLKVGLIPVIQMTVLLPLSFYLTQIFNQKSIADECLDLVDENDKVIGKKKRSEVYNENLSNFRVVNAFIVNSKGEMWIPRRTAHKRIFPLCLDVSMGGHLKSGERYDQALKRETKEELNIDTDTAQIRLLGFLTPRKNNVSAFMNVYEIKMDKAPNYNKKDFTEYFWLTPKALFERIEKGEKTKDDLPKLVKIFYCAK